MPAAKDPGVGGSPTPEDFSFRTEDLERLAAAHRPCGELEKSCTRDRTVKGQTPMSTAPKAQALRLAEMAPYQDDSIVSRQVTKADAGNVTLFAFDAGQELSEHTAPFDALVHVLDGEAEISISRRPFRLAAGDAIIMPAGEPHAVKAVSRFRMLLTMIRT
jgi:quercetin dioxygenase-like cupin family protein